MFPLRDHNPSLKTPFVTWALMALNILIFVGYSITFQSDRELAVFFANWGLVPANVADNPSGIVTSMFLHAGFLHLGGNMLFLWIFGDNMEDEMGHLGFLGFYLAAGLGAAALQYAADPGSEIPMIGASGAIAGVMGGYLLLFPKAKVDILIIIVILFRIVPVPSWIMLGVWFGLQLLGGFTSPSDEGGVAYWAHAGGFVAGVLLTLPLWLRLGGTQFWERTHGHPPHPDAQYRHVRSGVPRVKR